MVRPASQMKYVAKYKAMNITKVSVEFNKNKSSDMEMLEWVKQQPSKQGYIKQLISEDMKKNQKHQ